MEEVLVPGADALDLGFGEVRGSGLVVLLRDAHDFVDHAEIVPVVKNKVADAVIRVNLLPEGHVGSKRNWPWEMGVLCAIGHIGRGKSRPDKKEVDQQHWEENE
jgi:hypothetical protein